MRSFCNQVTLMGEVTEMLAGAPHQMTLDGKGIDFEIRCCSGDQFYVKESPKLSK